MRAHHSIVPGHIRSSAIASFATQSKSSIAPAATAATGTSENARIDSFMAVCKNRGFVYPVRGNCTLLSVGIFTDCAFACVFQSSDIYGGMSSSYEYGPIGTQLKKNISVRTATAVPVYTSLYQQSVVFVRACCGAGFVVA
jgi:hypothetical protein